MSRRSRFYRSVGKATLSGDMTPKAEDKADITAWIFQSGENQACPSWVFENARSTMCSNMGIKDSGSP